MIKRTNSEDKWSLHFFCSKQPCIPTVAANIVVMVSLIGVSGVGVAHAELSPITPDQAVEAASEGLKRESSFPWYDAKKDELRPVTLRQKKAPKDAKDWEATERQPKKKRNRGTGNWNLLSGLSVVAQVMVYLLLLGLICAAIYFLVNSERLQEFFSQKRKEEEEEDGITDEQRMENLPFEVRRPRADLLSEAKRLYEMGRYGEAIVYLFSYQLLQLDKNQWIRLAKGKTNRQYLREIRQNRGLKGVLQGTMIPFEDFFFGHYAIEQERFESCWERMDEFHKLVRAKGAT